MTTVVQHPIQFTPEGAVSISYPTLVADPRSLTSSIGAVHATNLLIEAIVEYRYY